MTRHGGDFGVAEARAEEEAETDELRGPDAEKREGDGPVRVFEWVRPDRRDQERHQRERRVGRGEPRAPVRAARRAHELQPLAQPQLFLEHDALAHGRGGDDDRNRS